MSIVNNLYRYRMFCVTENKFVVTVLSDSGTPAVAPSACPNSGAHTIAATSVKLVNVVYPDEVYIDEHDKMNVVTGGNYYAESIKLQMVLGESIPETTSKIFPMNVAIYSAKFVVENRNIGDRLVVTISPDTPVGPPTSAVSIGDTVLDISAGTMPHVLVGFYLKISEGGTTNDLGRILYVDWETNQITVGTAATDAFTTSAQLLLTVRFCDVTFSNSDVLVFGANSIGGTILPKDTPLSMAYYNYSGGTKNITLIVELTY